MSRPGSSSSAASTSRPDGEAAARRRPHAVRLAGRRPGRAAQPGPCGARGPGTAPPRARPGCRPATRPRRCSPPSRPTAWSGLRDRALIGTLLYTFARVSAALAMRVEDYYPVGRRWWLRLHEKGGKHHEMPAHHTLQDALDAYLEAAGIADDRKGPLFRSAQGRTGRLTGQADGPRRRLPHDRPPRRRRRRRHPDRLPLLAGARHHRLSRERRPARARPGHGRPRLAPAPPSSTTAAARPSPSTRSSGSCSDVRPPPGRFHSPGRAGTIEKTGRRSAPGDDMRLPFSWEG